jgi:hypothetical protein
MVLPNGKVIAPTGKAFDVNSAKPRSEGDRLIIISAWDAALQAKQLGLAVAGASVQQWVGRREP